MNVSVVVLFLCLLLDFVTVHSLPIRVGAIVYAAFILVKLLLLRGIAAQEARIMALTGAAIGGGLLTAAVTLVIVPTSVWYSYFALTVALSVVCLAGVILQYANLARTIGFGWASTAMIAPILFAPSAGPSLIGANPWKFWLAWPLSIIVLVILRNRPWLEIAALVSLAAISFLNDTRSGGAIAITVAALCLVRRFAPVQQVIHGIRGITGRVALAVLVVVGAVGAGLQLAAAFVQLAVSGALGPAIAQKQAAQSNGSDGIVALIVGARAEAPVTLHLITLQPWGFGLGVVGSPSDVYSSQTVYRGAVEHNVTLSETSPVGVISADGTQLHSIAADMWYNLGLIGIAVVVTMAVVAFVAGARAFASPRLPAFGLTAFLAVSLLFDLAFSPLRGNWYQSGIALGVALFVLQLSHGDRSTHLRRATHGGRDMRV